MEQTYNAQPWGETIRRRARYIARLKTTNFLTDDLTDLRVEQRAVDPDEFHWLQYAPANLEQLV